MPEPGSIVAEYAKSGRSSCRKCKSAIGQGTVRIGLYVTSPKFDGVTPTWYHSDCFLNQQVGKKITSIDAIEKLEELRNDDQEKVRNKFDQLMGGKRAAGVPINEFGLRVEYAKSGGSQCRGCAEKIAKNLPRLAYDEDGPYGPVPAWHHVDCWVEHCADRIRPLEQFAGYVSLSQVDRDMISEKFQHGPASTEKLATPEQSPVKPAAADTVAAQVKEQNAKVWSIKDSLSALRLNKAAYQAILKKNLINIELPEKELLNIVADCVMFGLGPICSECNKSRLVWNSGQYECPVHGEWAKCTKTMELEEVETVKMELPSFEELGLSKTEQKLFSTKPVKRVYVKKDTPKKPNLKRSRKPAGPEAEHKMLVTYKGRTAVDPDTGLVDTHHVYEDKSANLIYSATLAATDVSTGRNSYYNMQVLEADFVGSSTKRTYSDEAAYYFFRKWGRVGTSIGDNRLETCGSIEDALDIFRANYLEKTGNEFGEPFEKKPRLFYPLELAIPDKAKSLASTSKIAPGSKTSLAKSVQELLKLIFDPELMRKAMVELEIDIKKMPLGQLSKEQIKKAYVVLAQVSDALHADKAPSKGKLVQLSNQFFTLIPHDFGMDKAPLLENEDIVKGKLQLLDMLTELEIATKIISHDMFIDSDRDPLDVHYDSLKTEIGMLEKESAEFKVISKYVESTHAPTHTDYHLEVENVFCIKRQGEFESFQKFCVANPAAASNRQLLWHGSRITNYIGILSQGLRIAPPEAPSTGYMFGKGIYFADMATKSANYCCATPSDSRGIMLLSEVALGPMYEKTESEFIEHLKPGYFSTKGCGKTVPAKSVEFPADDLSGIGPVAVPETSVETGKRRSTRGKAAPVDSEAAGKLICPMGPPKQLPKQKGDLLYNEYIVYNPSQVNIHYLVQLKFSFTKKR